MRRRTRPRQPWRAVHEHHAGAHGFNPVRIAGPVTMGNREALFAAQGQAPAPGPAPAPAPGPAPAVPGPAPAAPGPALAPTDIFSQTVALHAGGREREPILAWARRSTCSPSTGWGSLPVPVSVAWSTTDGTALPRQRTGFALNSARHQADDHRDGRDGDEGLRGDRPHLRCHGSRTGHGRQASEGPTGLRDPDAGIPRPGHGELQQSEISRAGCRRDRVWNLLVQSCSRPAIAARAPGTPVRTKRSQTPSLPVRGRSRSSATVLTRVTVAQHHRTWREASR